MVRPTVSDNNRGPSINLATWICLVVMALATFIKVGTKLAMVHKVQYDDVYMLAAMVVTIAQSITQSIQVANGLGQHITVLNASQIDRYEQTQYASQILYILSVCLAKMAILVFMVSLGRNSTRRAVVTVTMGFNAIWATIATLAVAFQCGLPRPWAVLSSQCFQQPAFWNTYAALDIAVDLIIVVLPFYLLHDIQLPLNKRVYLMFAFSTRFLMIPVIIVRLIYLDQVYQSSDHPFDNHKLAILTSVHVNLSVITSCIPFLKPFMDSIQTGILASDLRSLNPGQSVKSNSNMYPLRSTSKPPNGGIGRATNAWSRIAGTSNNVNITSGTAHRQRRSDLADESQERMIIKQTKTVAVDYDIPQHESQSGNGTADRSWLSV